MVCRDVVVNTPQFLPHWGGMKNYPEHEIKEFECVWWRGGDEEGDDQCCWYEQVEEKEEEGGDVLIKLCVSAASATRN